MLVAEQRKHALHGTMVVFRREARRQPPMLITRTRFDRSDAKLSGGLVVRYEKGIADPVAAGMHHIDYGFSIVDREQVMPPIAGLAELENVLGGLRNP